jgi:putative hydrolase of HD superfamily
MSQKISTKATEVQRIINFVHYAEGLKTELRDMWLSNGQQESTAEHCWRMALMAMLIGPKLKIKIDFEKAIKIAVIHDIVEIEAKDTPLFKHFGNSNIQEDKKVREEKAINNIKAMLDNDGNEARFIKILDKLESRLQYIKDETKVFRKEDLAKFSAIQEGITKLCSIDSFLEEIDKLTVSERPKQLKNKNFRFKKE